MTPQELAGFEKLGNGRAAYEADVLARPTYPDGGPRKTWSELSEPVRQTWERNPTPRFAAVVSLRDRLTVLGSAELLSQVLPKHSPSSILPGDWIEHHYAARARPLLVHGEAR